MSAPDEFPAYLLAPQFGASMALLSRQATETAQDLKNLPPGIVTELPAKITAWDAATQRASWTERTWDAHGSRIDKPNGLSGSPTYMPAVPVGNGLMPPPLFPVDVLLRRRLEATNAATGKPLGVVWEFDWVCACGGHGSGSGSGSGSGGGGGGGGVLTSCCPGGVATHLSITITQTAGPACALDGTTFGLDYNSAADRWEALNVVAVTLTCTGGSWTLQLTSRISDCSFGPAGMTIDSCEPLHLTLTGMTCAGADCAGATFTVTVTA